MPLRTHVWPDRLQQTPKRTPSPSARLMLNLATRLWSLHYKCVLKSTSSPSASKYQVSS